VAKQNIDKGKAKRLKELRESNSSISFVKEHCRQMNGGHGSCGDYNGDGDYCDGCPNLDGRLTPERLGAILGERSGSLIRGIENGTRALSAVMEEEYRKFFGTELFDEALAGNDRTRVSPFKRKGISPPQKILHRSREIEAVCKLIKSGTVTVICADGGVGKTTLAKAALYSVRDEYTYYGALTAFTASGGMRDDIRALLGSLELTLEAQARFSEYAKDFDTERQITERETWICKQIAELDNGALFLIDNLDMLTAEAVSYLEEEYPNCKFLITARRARGVREDIILHLDSFSAPEAQELFECYFGRALTEDEIYIFDSKINSWCEGNAEALYYAARMLVANIGSVSEYSEIERWGVFYTDLEKDLCGESTISQKLSYLIRLDGDICARIEGGCADSEIKLLSVLSLTEMHGVDIDEISELVGEGKEFRPTVKALEEKGLIKIDERLLGMHPLIAHALRLNGIEGSYTDNVLLFAYLSTGIKEIKNRCELMKRSVINVPNGVRRIPDFAFLSCYKLTEINLPDTVCMIGCGAFCDCEALEMVRLPFGLRDIKEDTFEGCRRLSHINLPSSVTQIGKKAFYDCSLLKVVNLDGVKMIEDAAFCNCYSLEQINLPDSLLTIGNAAFAECAIERVEIPDSVTKIGKAAFMDCKYLESVKIGKRVEFIGEEAFAGCDALNRFEINDENLTYKIIDAKLCYSDGEPININQRRKKTIKERLFDEADSTNLVLYGDRGKELVFEQVAVIDYDGKWYCILRPVIDDEAVSNGACLIFEISESEDMLLIVTEPNVIEKVALRYEKLLEEEQ